MLHGMAGIGKTYLAKKLAIDVQSYFPGGVITVELGENIISEERAQDALRKLASHAFGGKMDQLGRHLQPSQVANWLQATAPGRLLVIIDDVWNDKVLRFFKEALPADAVHLVTTRNANIAWALGGRKYPLNRLTDEDSITLLEKRLGWLDYTTYLPALKKLVSLLERHALALDIIAACIKEPYRLQDTLDALEKGVGHERLSQLKLPEGEERDECREIAGVELLLYDS